MMKIDFFQHSSIIYIMTRTTLSPSREPSLSPAKDEESPSGIDEKERNDIIRMIFDLPRGVQIYEGT